MLLPTVLENPGKTPELLKKNKKKLLQPTMVRLAFHDSFNVVTMQYNHYAIWTLETLHPAKHPPDNLM